MLIKLLEKKVDSRLKKSDIEETTCHEFMWKGETRILLGNIKKITRRKMITYN